MSKVATNNLPSNDHAEKSVLAAWLGGQEGLDESPDPVLFWNPAHREIAHAIYELRSQGGEVELNSVWDQIQRNNKNSCCTHIHISEITFAGLGSTTYTSSLSLLKSLHSRRRIQELGETLSTRALTGDPLPGLIQYAYGVIENESEAFNRQSDNLALVTADDLNSMVIPENNPAEIFRHRYLCRKSALLFISNTGQGKSTLIYQGAYSWAIGKEAFGLEPARPLTVLVVQAENDEQDLAEMVQGGQKGLLGQKTSEEDLLEARKRVLFFTENSAVGSAFMARLGNVLKKLRKEGINVDLLVIDPVLSYLGGDPSKAEVVTPWLRQGIQELMDRFDCASILIAHTAKPQVNHGRRIGSGIDEWYAALGSVEWVNYCRASLLLKPMGGGMFELRAGKRGSRLRWKDKNQVPTYSQRLAHAKDGGIYWRVPEEDEFEASTTQSSGRLRNPSVEDFMTLFLYTYEGPSGMASTLTSGEMKSEFKARGWVKDEYSAKRDRAEALGLIKQIIGGKPNEKRYAITEIADRINKEGAIRLQEEKAAKMELKQKKLSGMESLK